MKKVKVIPLKCQIFRDVLLREIVWLRLLKWGRMPHPAGSSANLKMVIVSHVQVLNFLVLDIDAYSERYGSKAIRKNITIPAWLNTYGEKNNVNFSKVLTDALLKQASN